MWSRAHPDLKQSHCDLVASGDEGLVEDWALEQRLLSHYLMDLQRSRQPELTGQSKQAEGKQMRSSAWGPPSLWLNMNCTHMGGHAMREMKTLPGKEQLLQSQTVPQTQKHQELHFIPISQSEEISLNAYGVG